MMLNLYKYFDRPTDLPLYGTMRPKLDLFVTIKKLLWWSIRDFNDDMMDVDENGDWKEIECTCDLTPDRKLKISIIGSNLLFCYVEIKDDKVYFVNEDETVITTTNNDADEKSLRTVLNYVTYHSKGVEQYRNK